MVSEPWTRPVSVLSEHRTGDAVDSPLLVGTALAGNEKVQQLRVSGTRVPAAKGHSWVCTDTRCRNRL